MCPYPNILVLKSHKNPSMYIMKSECMHILIISDQWPLDFDSTFVMWHVTPNPNILVFKSHENQSMYILSEYELKWSLWPHICGVTCDPLT